MIPIIERDDVAKLEEFVSTHPGVEDERIIGRAVQADSVKIVKEWVQRTGLVSVAVQEAQMVNPGRVLEWLIEEGHMVGLDDFMMEWRVWVRLLRLDVGHKCYPAEMAEKLRDQDCIRDWVASCIEERLVSKGGSLEELKWFTAEFGERIWRDLHWNRLVCNGHADVVEKYYSKITWTQHVLHPWTYLARYGTPEVAEVVRRLPGNPITGDPAGKFPQKPTLGALHVAMKYGNLVMYRYMREEFGKAAKSSKIMCLACCKSGDEEDVREYWMADPKIMTRTAVLLFVRGMYTLVKELMEGSAPDVDTLLRAVDALSYKVGVLRGLVYMGWKGLIPMKRKTTRDQLEKTAIRNMYWPWFQEKISDKGVFFTVDDVLSSGLQD